MNRFKAESSIQNKPIRAQKSFLLPVMITAGLLILIPLSTQFLLGIAPHLISTIAQVIVFLAFMVLLHGALKRRAETKRKIEELNKILNEQYDLDSKQNSFMNTISKELRPYIQEVWSLSETQDVNEQSRKFIEAGLKEIAETIETFGFISRLDRNRIKSDGSTASLRGIMEGVENSVSKGTTTFVYDFPDILKVAHHSVVEKVLFALVANALEHSGTKGAIKIRYKNRRRKPAEIIVEDGGKGIPKEKMAILFKPMTRVEDAKEFSHQGRGMSLFVSRLLMRYIGGDLRAESELGKGTKMHIILPKA